MKGLLSIVGLDEYVARQLLRERGYTFQVRPIDEQPPREFPMSRRRRVFWVQEGPDGNPLLYTGPVQSENPDLCALRGSSADEMEDA